MSNINVIDEPCGKGKTSFAIQMMNDSPDESYIYCTPFLDEIERVKKATNIDITAPDYKGGRKIDDFNSLLMSGRNIALTHSTFSNSNSETIEYLTEGNYTLILDEVLDILIRFNDVCNDNLTKADIKLLFNEKFIETDEYGKVYWIKDSYPTSKYSNVERLAKNGNLFYLDKTMLVWQFPAHIFHLFKKVYVLTYLFEGSFLKPFFEYHNIDYEIVGLTKNENGIYRTCQHNRDIEAQARYKELITIYENPKLNNYKASSLSKTWYDRQKPSEIKQLQLNIFNFLHNVMKAKSEKILWTCPNDYKQFLKGKGYNVVRKLTEKERTLSKGEKEKLEKKLSCFIPLNARATNEYSDRNILVYAFNFYSNPYVRRYFTNKNEKDGTNITVNQDYLALSCLIQWIWRSSIRNNEPITIYIPSERMRLLFKKWLNGEM